MFVSVAEPKIHNLEPVLPIDQQVLRLQVAMHDIELMEVRDAADDMLEEPASLRLL